MARHKDVNWTLHEPVSWNDINAALLMDIRDELQRLNAVLHCPDFLDIPRQLRLIRQNITKPKKRAKLKSVKRRAA